MSSHTVSTCIYCNIYIIIYLCIYIYIIYYLYYIYACIISLISINCHIRWFCCRIMPDPWPVFRWWSLWIRKGCSRWIAGLGGCWVSALGHRGVVASEAHGTCGAWAGPWNGRMAGPTGLPLLWIEHAVIATVGVVILCYYICYSSIFFPLPLPSWPSLQDVLHGCSEGTVGTQTCSHAPRMKPQFLI